MSCWVVPAVAAELWQMPVALIVERVKKGEIPTKTELGFTLVDVAPNSPRIEYPIREPGTAPKTYVTVEVPADAEPEAESQEQLDWRPTRARVSRLRRPPIRPAECMPMAA